MYLFSRVSLSIFWFHSKKRKKRQDFCSSLFFSIVLGEYGISFQKLLFFFESNIQSEWIFNRIFNQKIKSPINNQRVCTIYRRAVVVIKRKKWNRKWLKSENSCWTFALAALLICIQKGSSGVRRPGDATREQRTVDGPALQKAGTGKTAY